ncbi:MAG: phosphoserine phosphatase SerB [Pseudomonadota bacterium]
MQQAAGIIIFDMDSTLIDIECIDEIANLIDVKDKVAAITAQAMRGELDFAESLRERVKCLTGVNEQKFEQLFEPIPLMPGAQHLVQRLQQQGWKTALVSGGFDWFAQRVAHRLQLDSYLANQLQINDKALTGSLTGDIIDGAGKAKQLQQLQRDWSVEKGTTVAVGDGANDSLMLQAADVGIAFCAKPALKQVADFCIDTPDLTLVLPILQRLGLLEH